MSHKLDLRGRLDGPGLTITPADLLLSKLQVWEILGARPGLGPQRRPSSVHRGDPADSG